MLRVSVNYRNKQRAQHRLVSRVSAFLLLTLVVVGGSVALAVSRTSNAQGDDQNMAAAVLELTNNERTDRGLTSLTENNRLERAARAKAQDMFVEGYFAHTSPEGRAPWFFIDAAAYAYVYAGENLAIDYTDPVAVMDAWMKSPTHAENILTQQYRDIGIAVVHGQMKGRETTLIVQMFGTPEGK